MVTATGYPAPTFSSTGLPSWGNLNATTGVLSGTPPTTTGTPFTIILTAANGNLPNATQNFSLNVKQPQTFTGWETAKGISSPATATPQNDGVSNLFKYLYDINPSVPMSAADRAALPVTDVTTSGGKSYLTLTYRQNPLVTGITVNVQTSPDLQTWTTLTQTQTPPPTTSTYIVQQVSTDSDTGDPMMQVQIPVSSEGRQFIRLNITSP